jgi:hypothetical protein
VRSMPTCRDILSVPTLELCVVVAQAGFWGPGPFTTAGAYLDSSGGFTFSPPGAAVRPSAVTTVVIDADPTSGCFFPLWGDKALGALPPSLNEVDFTFKLFLLPTETACAWGGIAYTSACSFAADMSHCRAWVRGEEPDRSWYHELGHNVGMHHAATGSNSAVEDEYGDYSCVMSSEVRVGASRCGMGVGVGLSGEVSGNGAGKAPR